MARFFLFSKTTLQTHAPTILLVVLAAYVTYGTVGAVQRSNAELAERDALEQKLANLSLEKEKLQSLVVYYATPTFQELELRRTLLLARADEQVFRLPEKHNGRRPGELAQVGGAATNTAPATEGAGVLRWMQFLRGEIR